MKNLSYETSTSNLEINLKTKKACVRLDKTSPNKYGYRNHDFLKAHI